MVAVVDLAGVTIVRNGATLINDITGGSTKPIAG